MYARADFSYAAEPPPRLMQVVSRLDENARALDLGCGDGRVALYLAEQGISVTAVDISRRGLEKLRKFAEERGLVERIETVKADVRSVALEEESFDLIAAVTVLDHLPGQDVAPTFARVLRSLKVDGYLYASVHLALDPGNTAGETPESESAAAIEHYFDRGELRRLAESHLAVEAYEERREEDRTHGDRHFHAFAELLGRNLSPQLRLI